MKITLFFLCVVVCFTSLKAQHILPRKLDGCNTSEFCLDCGTVKAGVDSGRFTKLMDSIAQLHDLSRIEGGAVMFQVLVESNGKGCVLSHTDESDQPITLQLVSALNAFRGYQPAKTKQKIETRVSILIAIQVLNGRLLGKVERIDPSSMKFE